MLIKNCRYFDGESFSDTINEIMVSDGVVAGVGTNLGKDNDTIDAKGRIVCPGYVDIHTHGIAGYDNSNINREDIPGMAEAYYKCGTTTFIPSFPTISSDAICSSMEEYGNSTVKVPGIHLEGPYINNQKRGAQNPAYIQRPDASWFDNKYKKYLKMIKRVTIAPEEDTGFEFTRYLVDNDIRISFGHTVCDAEMAVDFFGMTDAIATHTFNAMPSIHHRKPSITTVALNSENVYCEVIADLLHLHPEIIKLIFNIKGSEKTILVSDSMLAAGLPYGEYDFSGLHVTVGENGARLDSGNLAGSTITLADGVQRTIKCGIRVSDAIASATSTPAKAMKIDGSCGYIRVGYPADLLILNNDYSVEKVVKEGKIIC